VIVFYAELASNEYSNYIKFEPLFETFYGNLSCGEGLILMSFSWLKRLFLVSANLFLENVGFSFFFLSK
jgi:hypothetical protein